VPAITSTGIYPGTSNLMAAHMISEARQVRGLLTTLSCVRGEVHQIAAMQGRQGEVCGALLGLSTCQRTTPHPGARCCRSISRTARCGSSRGRVRCSLRASATATTPPAPAAWGPPSWRRPCCWPARRSWPTAMARRQVGASGVSSCRDKDAPRALSGKVSWCPFLGRQCCVLRSDSRGMHQRQHAVAAVAAL
jgi:hypothetical protein